VIARPHLEPLPATFKTTVAAFHRVAEQIVAFGAAILGELAATDQRAVALDFFTTRRDALLGR
jgi:hypothetical protein